VTLWNAHSQAFEPVYSESYCHNKIDEKVACDIYIEGTLKPWTLSLFLVKPEN
jgi:hypothetical protein